MNNLVSSINGIDKVLRVALAIMMALLVIDVTWQVLTRFILPQPSSFTEEVARFLLIWISLIGGAYAYKLHSHLGFDLFVRNLSMPNAVFMFRLCCVLVAIFAIWVLIIGGGNLVFLTWLLGQHSPVLNVPMAGVYLAIPLSGCLFLLYSTFFFLNAKNVVTASKEDALELENDHD
ncbi:TRAP transporter small permease [Paraglaciecola aquimarina]|uniref:TRAP transporter small permease protein n=1 Tax=Paraglaciecola algarum TaxID=3050085 RepID=A0ABS9D1S9_9ALTE|nr:TRAP transporter small permease [Paraglaciecola sp. G1-23]MCF2946836.1 TRAP transporter small permease [Paraglaciecola sp. G1-23]